MAAEISSFRIAGLKQIDQDHFLAGSHVIEILLCGRVIVVYGGLIMSNQQKTTDTNRVVVAALSDDSFVRLMQQLCDIPPTKNPSTPNPKK